MVEGQSATRIPFLVRSCLRQVTSKGQPYLKLSLVDRTGQIEGVAWENPDQLKLSLLDGSLAAVTFRVGSYNNSLQLTVSSAKSLDWADYDLGDFVTASRRSREEMERELREIIKGLQDPHYRSLVDAALAHPKTRDFWTIPAAKAFHHAYQRGLLEHTLSVAQLAVLVARHYGQVLNGDLLVAGAILHDVGKCWEFTPGPVTDYSTSGRLLGHLHMGAMFLGEVAAGLSDFPEDKLLLLRHLLVSHHGVPEFGSCPVPQILEGIALHQLDDLDGKLNGVGAFIQRDLRAQNKSSGWTVLNRLLNNYFLASPGVPLWGEGPTAADEGLVVPEPASYAQTGPPVDSGPVSAPAAFPRPEPPSYAQPGPPVDSGPVSAPASFPRPASPSYAQTGPFADFRPTPVREYPWEGAWSEPDPLDQDFSTPASPEALADQVKATPAVPAREPKPEPGPKANSPGPGKGSLF
ncbi:MAG: HDIG domain-containing protein [Deltaproteobacteria bacterium]|nr:HDIG domain-containing protein [Deltaproteobacteria bacterium]